MRIISLQAENFKRLRAVEIKLEGGKVIVIRGRNGAGKSSCIDSVWACLKGLDFCPTKPIRDGEEKAEIRLDLGEYVVTRTFTDKGSYLTVKSPDGAKIANPQALLNSFLGSFTFDPLTFARMKPPEQAKMLAEVSGIDLTSPNKQRKELYDERTAVNRAMAAAKAALTSVHGSVDGFSPEEYASERSTAEIADEVDRRGRQQAKVSSLLSKLKQAERDRELLRSRMQLLREELADCDKRLNLLNTEVTVSANEHEAAEGDLAAMPDVAAQMSDIEAHNEVVRKFREVNRAREEVVARQEESESLTAKIDEIDESKRSMVAASVLPVEGLSFDEAGVSFNGIPFDQCSSSEQLKVSTAIAVATNPTLRAIRITDGSLLDSDSMRVLQEIAHAEDFQILVERVDESKDGVGILIEDGSVVEQSD